MAIKPNINKIGAAPDYSSMTLDELRAEVKRRAEEKMAQEAAQRQAEEAERIRQQRNAEKIAGMANGMTESAQNAVQSAGRYASGWTNADAPVDAITSAQRNADTLSDYASLFSGELNRTFGSGAASDIYDAAKDTSGYLSDVRSGVRAQRDLYSQYENADDYNADQRLFSMSSDELKKEIDKTQSDIDAAKKNSKQDTANGGFLDTLVGMSAGGTGLARPAYRAAVPGSAGEASALENQLLKLNALYNSKKYSEDVSKYGIDPASMTYSQLMEARDNANGTKRTFIDDYINSVGESNMQTKRAVEWYASLPKDEKAKLDGIWENAQNSALAVIDRFMTGAHNATHFFKNQESDLIKTDAMRSELLKNGYSEEDADRIADLYSRRYNASQNAIEQARAKVRGDLHPVASQVSDAIGKVRNSAYNLGQPLGMWLGEYTSGKPVDVNNAVLRQDRAYETARNAAMNSSGWNSVESKAKGLFGDEAGARVTGWMKSAVSSGLDDLARNSTVGTVARVLGAEADVISKLVSVVASSNAALTEFRQNVESGKNTDEAFSRAALTGFIEFMTEMVGGEFVWNNILRTDSKGLMKIVTTVAKNALAEGTEEVMGNAAQRALNGLTADNLKATFESINNGNGAVKSFFDNTGWRQDVKSYTDQGLSLDSAMTRALGDWISEDVDAFMSAFLSAGLSSGGTMAINRAQTNSSKKVIGDMVNSLTHDGLLKMVRNVEAKLKSGASDGKPYTKEAAADDVERVRGALVNARENVVQSMTGEESTADDRAFAEKEAEKINRAIGQVEELSSAIRNDRTAEIPQIASSIEASIREETEREAEEARTKSKRERAISDFVRGLVYGGTRMAQIDQDLSAEIRRLDADAKSGVEGAQKKLDFANEALAYLRRYAADNMTRDGLESIGKSLDLLGHGKDRSVTIQYDYTWNDDQRNASYNRETNTVTLNPYSPMTQNHVRFVLGHELLHALRADGERGQAIVDSAWNTIQSLMESGQIRRDDENYNMDVLTKLYAGDVRSYLSGEEGRAEVASYVNQGMTEEAARAKAAEQYLKEEAVANFFGDASFWGLDKNGNPVDRRTLMWSENDTEQQRREKAERLKNLSPLFDVNAVLSDLTQSKARRVLSDFVRTIRNFARSIVGAKPVEAKRFDTLADAYEAVLKRFDAKPVNNTANTKNASEAAQGAATEAGDAIGDEAAGTVRNSRRTKAEPQKTIDVYKLMRLKDGKLYPLFIDSTEPIEVGVWYDADSPSLDFLKNMPSGVYLVDPKNGTYQSLADYQSENGEKAGKNPSKDAIANAAASGKRWVLIEDTERSQRRYGESRKYYNFGINGSGSVSTFAMRPGYHAGSLPTMRQIGKGANKDLRDDSFVWTRGRMPADIEYQKEADANPDKDIPTHIPTDGYYMKATNADAVKSQADRVGWYVGGSYIVDEIIGDEEARRVIDEWNEAHPDQQVEQDYPRESGKVFDAEKMALVEPKENVRHSRSADRFSLSKPVEETNRFIALHNMSEDALRGALELGGMAMPSIALVRSDTGHDTYGPISAVFGKDSVSPTDRRNKIFSGDAYTPSFPDVGYKIDSSVVDRIRKKVRGLLDASGVPRDEMDLALDTDNATDQITRSRGDFVSAYARRDGMKIAFLQDTGRGITIPMQEKVYTDLADIPTLRKISENIDVNDAYEQGHDAVMALEPQIRKYLRAYAEEKYGNAPELVDELVPENEPLSYRDVDRVIHAIRQLERSGETRRIDKKELNRRIDAAMEKDGVQTEYEDWLRELGEGIVERKGIRNEKDFFTPSGNRRTFDQLYYDYSLANIVKAMQKQETQGNTSFLTGSGNIRGAAAKQYGSIEEARKDIGRIRNLGVDETKEAEYEAFDEKCRDLCQRMVDGKGHNKYMGVIDAAEVLTETLSRYKTTDAIYRYLKREYDGWYNVTKEIAEDAAALVKEAQQLPVSYLEAKLYRAVTMDEPLAYVVPDTTSDELVQKMHDAGLNVLTYKSGDDADRLAKVNSVEGARFSRGRASGQMDMFEAELPPEKPKWTYTEFDGEFIWRANEIAEKAIATKHWTGKEIEDFFDEHPEYDFVKRFALKDNTARRDLDLLLSGIDDIKTLERMSWYTTQSHDSGYRSGVTKTRAAYKDRIARLNEEQGNGRVIKLEHRAYSIDEARKLFDELNSNPDLAKLADKVFAVASRFSGDEPTGLRFYATNKVLGSSVKGIAGQNIGNSVFLIQNHFANPAFSDQQKASTILHELIHACTFYAIEASTQSDFESRFGRGMVDAVDTIKSIYRQAIREDSLSGEYGLTDAAEFVAELSNEQFREKLAKVNLLDRLIAAVKRLFGIDTGNMLTGASAALDYLLDNVDDFNRRKYYAAQESAVSAQERIKGKSRFSRSLTPEQRKLLDAERRVERLKEDNEFLRRLMESGRKAALSPRSVERIVREVSDLYGLGRDERIRTALGIVDKLYNGKVTGKEREDAIRQLSALSRDMIRDAFYEEDPMREDRERLRAYLKDKTIRVTPELEGELKGRGEKWGDARNAMRKYLNLARNGTTSIDSIWEEMHDLFPGYFPMDVYTEADMIERVIEVLDGMEPQAVSVYPEEAVEQNAESLYNALVGKYAKYGDKAFGERLAEGDEAAAQRAEARADAEIASAKQSYFRDMGQQELKYLASIRRIEADAARDAKEYSDRIADLESQARAKAMRGSATEMLDAARKNARYIWSAAKNPTGKRFVPQNARGAMERLSNWIDSITVRGGVLNVDGKQPVGVALPSDPVRGDIAVIAKVYGAEYAELADALLNTIDYYARYQSGADYQRERNAEKSAWIAKTTYKLSQLLRSAISNQNRVWLDGKRRDAETVGGDMIDALNERRGADERFTSVKDKTFGEKAKEGASKLIRFWKTDPGLAVTDAYTFLHRIGGRGDEVFDTLRHAQETQTLRNQEFVESMQTKLKGIELWKYGDEKWDKYTVTFNDARGREVTVPRSVAMSVAALWRRMQGREHLENGGFVYDHDGKRSDPIRVGEKSVKSIEDALTEDDKKVMGAMLSFMQDDCTRWGNEATMRRYGFERFTTDNYFRIDVDKFALPANTNKSFSGQPKIENTSFAKPTREGAGAPVVAGDFIRSVIHHVNGMATYSAYLNAEGMVNQILSTKGLRETMQRVLGNGSVKYVEDLMTALKSQTRNEEDALEKLWSMGAAYYKTAAVAYNLSTALKQPISYTRAAAVMDTKYLTRGMKAVTSSEGRNRALGEMQEFSGTAVKKLNGYSDTGMARDTAMLIGAKKETVRQKIVEFGMRGAEFGDRITWEALWTACREETRDRNPDMTPPELMEATAKRFSSVVAQTQVTNSPLDTAPILRSNSVLTRNLFAFWNEPLKTYNLLMRAYDNIVQAKDGAAAKRAILAAARPVASVAAGMVLEAAVSALFRSLRDDRDDDMDDPETWKKLISLWGGEMVDNALGVLPYVDQFAEVIRNAMNGYSNTDMGLEVITDILDAAKALADSDGEKAKTEFSRIRALAEAVATAFGIPAKNALRTVKTIGSTVLNFGGNIKAQYNYQKIFYNPKNATAREKYGFADLLAKAYIEGDEEAYRYIRDDMIQMGISPASITKSIVKNAAPDDVGGSSSSLTAYKPGSDGWYLAIGAVYDRATGAPRGLEEEVTRLYEATGDSGVLPNFASDSFTVNGEEVKIEGEAYTEFSESYAKRLYEVQTAIRNTAGYRAASDEQKAWWMEKAETVIGAILKHGIDLDYNVTSQGKWIADYLNASDADIAKYIVENTAKKSGADSQQTKTRGAEVMNTPKSTEFSQIGYDPSTQTLAVTFRDSGATYTYGDVPESEWNAMQSADSIGKYYNANVKGKYKSEKAG